MQRNEHVKNKIHVNWVKKLNQIILENLESEDFSNAFLAKEMNVSEVHFYRLVKERTGQSPNKYIRELKMELAKEMIDSGKFNRVSLVAYKVGFQRVDYFSKLFEKHFGVRPITLIG